MLFGLLLALALAACRRAGTVQVAAPTATATPRSTPLPPVPTAIPVGAEDNPLQMVLRPVSSGVTARNAAAQVEEALRDSTGLAIEVVTVTSYAEALAALCNSAGGAVSAAWLDAISFAAATAGDCGVPALQVERGIGRGARTGETVQIIASSAGEFSGVRSLSEGTFCRLGYDDLYTWLVPSLVLQANGVRPLYDLTAINDYEDVPELLAAVAAGDCDAAGVTESAFEEYADADIRAAVSTLAETVALPYAVLAYPPALPLGARVALEDALLALESDDALQELLGQDALVPAAEDDFDALLSFVNRTGLDLAELGT